MEAFLEIVRQPDHVVVILLFLAVAGVSLVALREARRNDRLAGPDAKEERVERMDR